MPRKRWLYTQGGQPLPEPVEVSDEWRDPGIGQLCRSEAEVYNNLQASDGTPIDSRTKHRRYMQSNGLAMAGDYSENFRAGVKADRERQSDRAAERATVQAITQHKNRRRR